jgi:hypothetical protein
MKALFRRKILEPELHETCAVYDPRTGRIVHVHQMVRRPGVPALSKRDVEKRGAEVAAKLGHDVARLKTLRLEPGSFDRGKRYRIDVKSKRLIAIGLLARPLPGIPRVTGKRKTAAKKAASPRTRRAGRPKPSKRSSTKNG